MAELIRWKREYTVGIGKFDDQHKMLISIVNELYSLFINNQEKEKIVSVLNRLADYTFFHFSNEEQIFMDSKYPASISHIEEHYHFKNYLFQFSLEVKDGKNDVSAGFFSYLSNWLMNHFQEHDMKYSNYLKVHLGIPQNKFADIRY